jgi:hypothetical protein
MTTKKRKLWDTPEGLLDFGYEHKYRQAGTAEYVLDKLFDDPMQPVQLDDDDVYRFKANAIVRFLINAGPFDMNQLAFMPFSEEDRQQFAQLIGYSVSGYGELPYVNDESYERAQAMQLRAIEKAKTRASK